MQNKTTNLDINLLDSDLETELAKFEAEERAKLGLPADGSGSQWFDANPTTFTSDQRDQTTILHGGLTYAQDMFTEAALAGIGYKTEMLEVPTNDALQFGREYGNRGQCNPTYFTVGNLIKHLTYLRDVKGMSKEDIVAKHVFLTAGACGPCRFGTYTTEYRKALRDSGFDGFRVMLFQQQGGIKQATGAELGLKINKDFYLAFLKALVVGDVLNALMYRIRPYEVVPGSTNEAVTECRNVIAGALRGQTSLVKAVYRARKILSAVKVDRSTPKPKVGIIGEFWAMTTEGDGNYQLQKFLEGEGAEVDVQLITAWTLYMIWQGRWDTRRRAELRGTDDVRGGLAGVDVRKKLLSLAVAEKVVRGLFQVVAHGMGLYDYHLPDMDQMADVSHAFYDNELRGGEGHMEVGKLILNIAHSKVNMTLSVKPFGCMPSSSVSDGVQSLITEMYPEGIYLPIETNGDGAVNVYSRVQMQLFKAKQQAQRDLVSQLEKAGMTEQEFKHYLARYPRMNHAFHHSPHVVGCTSANLAAEVAARKDRIGLLKRRISKLWTGRKQARAQMSWLKNAAKAVAAKAKTKSAVQPDASELNIDPEMLAQLAPSVPKGKKSLRVLN